LVFRKKPGHEKIVHYALKDPGFGTVQEWKTIHVNGITHINRPAASVAVACTMIILLATTLYKAVACPFCLSPPQTMAEQISRADIVIIAELVRFRVYDGGTRPVSTLRIREYLRGKELASSRRELAVGQAVIIAAEATGQPGDLFLMYGTLPENALQVATSTFASPDPGNSARGRDDQSAGSVITAELTLTGDFSSTSSIQKASLVIPEWISWNETLAISGEAVDYLRALPPTSVPQRSRLEYFIPFLEHRDALIAIDAWAEFGNSSYNDVISIRDRLSRGKLRAWIADPGMSPERLGLYGMMLGLCGTAADADFLFDHMQTSPATSDSELVAPQKTFRYGSEGLMGGYLLLTGEHGLQQLEKYIVVPADAQDTACHALVQSLQFMWSYESDIISPDRICHTMRLLLNKDSMREIAITNLSRWEDWSTLQILVPMFDGACSTDRSAQRAIIQFAQVCHKNAKLKEQTRPLADDAESFLCHVHATRPDLLHANRREFRSPQ